MRVGYWWESQKEETTRRPRRRWVDLREIGWDGMDWIDLAKDRDQWRAHGNEPPGSIKCWEVLQ
jgi:hypothetical protein